MDARCNLNLNIQNLRWSDTFWAVFLDTGQEEALQDHHEPEWHS
jgi:hypothetical protein